MGSTPSLLFFLGFYIFELYGRLLLSRFRREGRYGVKGKIKARHIFVVLLLALFYTSAGMIGRGWIWGIVLLLAASGIMLIPVCMVLWQDRDRRKCRNPDMAG